MQPVLIAFAATVFGLALAPLYTFPSPFGWSLLPLFLGVFFLLRLWQKTSLYLLFIVFFLLANLRYPQQFSARADLLQLDQLAKKVTVSGEVTDVRQLTDERVLLLVVVDSVARKNQNIPLAAPFTLRIYLDEGPTPVLPGDVIRCRTRLRKPRLFGTPGEFDYPRYLASQRVAMTGWVKNSERIEVVRSGTAVLHRAMVGWKSRVANEICASMPARSASLTRALVLGEGRVLPLELRKTLSRAGVSHLFAISGLHLGMIGVLGYVLLLFVYRRCHFLLNWQPPQRIIPLILLPVLLAYLLLTGDAVSTRRAFALALCGAVFIHWRYHVNPLQLLGTLAFISLLVNPLLLWQAGWQLSFAGATGILLWQPLLRRYGQAWPRFLRYLLQLVLVTCAATLATLPFVLFNFHILAPAGIIANLFCVPAVTLLALPLGLLALILEPLFPPLAQLLFQGCGWVLDGVVTLAAKLTGFPGLSGDYLFLSHWQYFAIGLFVLPGLLLVQLKSRELIVLSLLCAIVGAFLWQFPQSDRAPVSLTMFSVGQGESMLLRNRKGQTILIDGGGFYSDRFDVGERLLAPAFGELGITKVDAVVLTHDDLDHRKGLVFILKHFPVGKFMTGIPVTQLNYALRNALEQKQIPVQLVPRGWSSISFWEEGHLQIFNGRYDDCSDNDASLVIHLGARGGDGLLLTGDLEEGGVAKLLAAGVPGKVSLLKLPHHGSRFSAPDRLLDQLKPRLCLVSAGYQNRYKLPAREVISSLQQRKIPLYRTDLDGTLRARLSACGWQISHWERGFFVDR